LLAPEPIGFRCGAENPVKLDAWLLRIQEGTETVGQGWKANGGEG
jgi:hypothetical protein